MGIRTDLAVEFAADKINMDNGIKIKTYIHGFVKVTKVDILTEKAANIIGKPIGKYITFETERKINIFDTDDLFEIIADELNKLILKISGAVLVVGIGNITVTPDALGPKAAEHIMATRHISKDFAVRYGLNGLRSVSVISPGVLGQTGIEVKEIIEGTIERIRPELIILIDALAAREVSRLGNTVQLSNTGISPGSGVGNERTELSENTLGVRCVSIGVPTVVDASTLCYDLSGTENAEHDSFIVTPRDIDRIIEKSSKTIANSINITLQPSIDREFLTSYV